MRIIYLLLFIVLQYFSTQAQNKAMTFQQAKQKGISIERLDSLYPGALHSDSTKAVFGTKQEEFIEGYKKTLKDLAAYLKTHNYSWDKPTKCFNRIYFNKNGQVDFFLYNFPKDEITSEKQKQFDLLLNQFVEKYYFPMTAQSGFAQCSPVRYSD